MSHQGFTLEELTKLEGHAKLSVEMEGNVVKNTKLEVYEASRYFESLLLGRDYREAPTITQKICGICSVVHTLASIKAVEDAIGFVPSEQTVDLRKLLLYASNIHSHTAHLFFFALPDYLGFGDVIELSKKKHDYIHLALDLQQLSSEMVKIIGGRALHPVTPMIGGFHSVPDEKKIAALLKRLEGVKRLSLRTARLFSGLEVPELEARSRHLYMKSNNEYTLYDGMITSNDGITFRPRDYKKNIIEGVMEYSNSKHAKLRGMSYMTGALPRLNANYAKLSDDAKAMLKKSHLKLPSNNPFHNNFAQAIEMVHFADEAKSMLEKYRNGMQQEKHAVTVREGEGVGCCEAPRGLLFHHYGIGSDGRIKYANVITPTSQNAARMEDDISIFLPTLRGKPANKVKLLLEMLIRAYDPCFSCSAHFLELNLKQK
ncbi:MAG: Ni/Fe hydrogenase subunit alpha [Candidatus Aenigmatarchaeota archaeon]